MLREAMTAIPSAGVGLEGHVAESLTRTRPETNCWRCWWWLQLCTLRRVRRAVRCALRLLRLCGGLQRALRFFCDSVALCGVRCALAMCVCGGGEQQLGGFTTEEILPHNTTSP